MRHRRHVIACDITDCPAQFVADELLSATEARAAAAAIGWRYERPLAAAANAGEFRPAAVEVQRADICPDHPHLPSITPLTERTT